jgi:putative spermidine/putrescine transport system substrate-binding protein
MHTQTRTRFWSRFGFTLMALLAALALGSAFAQKADCGTSDVITLNLYSAGDVNVKDLFANSILPAYAKVCPNIGINLVFSEHNAGDQLTFDRIAAAKKAGKVSGVDLWETNRLLQAGEAGIADKISADNIPNLSKVDPAVMQQVGGYGVPYRGSSVVLAYNSKDVKNPPTTLDGLFAWIKAHPGKFTYNPPDTGGSGQNFVTAVLSTGISQDDLHTFQTSYDPSMEDQWAQGWKKLKDLGQYMYQGGFYPKGNAGVLQLLGRDSIWMAPVWSDMGLSYLEQGLLPDSVKLEQLDPPFAGGAAYIGIISDSPHKKADYAFLNWLLTPNTQALIIKEMNGYPGVEWKYVPEDVQQKFAAIAKSYTFSFSAKFNNDLNQQWYQQVAGHPAPQN